MNFNYNHLHVQRFFLISILVLFSLSIYSQDFSKMKVADIYRNLCSSCHVTGAIGGSLKDGIWKNGNTDYALLKSIKYGIPEKGMAAFNNTLTDRQLRAIVVYIRELEAKDKNNPANTKPYKGSNGIIRTQYHDYKIKILVEGFKTPWSIAFLPNGEKLVTERLGAIHLISANNKLDTIPVENTPEVIFDGPEGGMMDIALHPEYKNNGWIYLAFADGWRDANGKSRSQTAIVRGRIRNHKWVDQEWIYKADSKFYMRSGAHFGTRIAFKNGYVYFVIGERGAMGQAQDLTRPNGKIMRLHDDGKIPTDNPFINDDNIPDAIWSYGHRNPQGLVVSSDNKLYATEHGARGGDEFNLIMKGKNYGWPVITHGINYNGQPITSKTEQEGMEQPLVQWTPSIAPCGLTQYQGEIFPNWENDFFAGSLKAEELRRIRINEGQASKQEIILKGMGRIRDVRTGPDGTIYILTDEPARLLQMVPVD
ncbi:PQQ-dependent sugar dehydrogenase [Flavisericum labens]|uniref:PQQ-dependent sugar dehydrogenase n=1 Tax=Flavisericum labens TaxID=3377112 RepID=UPI00387B49A8